SLSCHAQFQTGFIERLQGTYGVDAVAGNDAPGTLDPQDYPRFFAKPISTAKYFGVHAYGKPGAGTLQTDDATYYALRYRLIHDALVKGGVRMPASGFLLTETGLYDGFRNLVPEDAMANDFIWLAQQTERDSYVRGQMTFGLSLNSSFQPFDLLGTTVTGSLGAFNAARVS